MGAESGRRALREQQEPMTQEEIEDAVEGGGDVEGYGPSGPAGENEQPDVAEAGDDLRDAEQYVSDDAMRDRFVEVFGTEAALQIETASRVHIGDLGMTVTEGDIGSSAFAYHFVHCVARDCLTRWRTGHGIETSEQELRLWALETNVVGEFDGRVPDLLSLLDGTYKAWTARG